MVNMKCITQAAGTCGVDSAVSTFNFAFCANIFHWHVAHKKAGFLHKKMNVPSPNMTVVIHSL